MLMLITSMTSARDLSSERQDFLEFIASHKPLTDFHEGVNELNIMADFNTIRQYHPKSIWFYHDPQDKYSQELLKILDMFARERNDILVVKISDGKEFGLVKYLKFQSKPELRFRFRDVVSDGFKGTFNLRRLEESALKVFGKKSY